MRALRAALVAVVLAAALRPEFPRYHAERELRTATEALRFVIMHPQEIADPPGALERIAAIAQSCGLALPGDPRPPILEGSAWFVRGDFERAAEIYRSALAFGERAETDLNLGRALERLGRENEAHAAFLRAAWVSPLLLEAMLPDIAAAVSADLARLDAELRAGRLSAPPPLPP
jgi:tetratricopeptide (TPR) repeat protein